MYNAFVSCSLRKEDSQFVELVERILGHFSIKAFGTVGRHDASAQNPIDHITRNIANADLLVVVATPRYIQQDLGTGRIEKALSEMIQVESAMAVAHGKPVLVFAQSGTDIGGFLPNVTQPIYLTGAQFDLHQNEKLIISLCGNTLQWLENRKQELNTQATSDFIVGGLAIFGSVKLIQLLFEEADEFTQK